MTKRPALVHRPPHSLSIPRFIHGVKFPAPQVIDAPRGGRGSQSFTGLAVPFRKRRGPALWRRPLFRYLIVGRPPQTKSPAIFPTIEFHHLVPPHPRSVNCFVSVHISSYKAQREKYRSCHILSGDTAFAPRRLFKPVCLSNGCLNLLTAHALVAELFHLNNTRRRTSCQTERQSPRERKFRY